MPIEISRFDAVSASDADLAEHYALDSAVMGLDYPNQSMPTLSEYVELIRHPLTGLGPIRRWVARDNGHIIGNISATLPEHENQHVGIVRAIVLPARRREGVGTELLREVLPTLIADGRTVVMGHGVKADASGESWARELGFVRTQAYVRQLLSVPETDTGLWQRPVADGFRLEGWTGRAPEALLAEYARARTAIVDAPNGESALAFENWTPERVRTHEADLRTQGVTSRVTVAVHEASGRIAGLTELGLRGGGSKSFQLDTAVVAEFRGHALGLAVKGATLRWLATEHPAVTEVYTRTAHDNEHMIRINLALGYATTGVVAELEAGAAELAKRLEGR